VTKPATASLEASATQGTLFRRVILGVVAGMAVYVGFALWADARQVGAALGRFHWWTAGAGLVLAGLNYSLRFVRWQSYLSRLQLKVPPKESLLVFLSGFALTVTPGKLGEALKSLLLKQSHGMAVARTAPIVLVERLTDLAGLLLLAAVGAFSFSVDKRFLLAGAAIVLLGLLFASVEAFAIPAINLVGRIRRLRRIANSLAEAHASTVVLLKPVPLVSATLLSAVAWACECLAFWLIVNGFEGATLGMQAGTFIYAAMTIAGALSFLPGGLGVTEAGMLALLVKFGTGIDHGAGAAATILTRIVTLWFAVVVGLAALLLYTRHQKALKAPPL
jgi:glycosyltransferase 2 family protein